MINKYLLILTIVTSVSCSNSNTSKSNNIDDEIQIIKLTEKIEEIKQRHLILKTHKADKVKIDSLTRLITTYSNKLDSLHNVSGLNLEKAEQNCINYFELGTGKLNNDKMNLLFRYYGYKVCGPGWVACGFSVDSTEDQARKRQNETIEAKKNYESYIDSILTLYLKKSFPKVDNEVKPAFYHVAEKTLQHDTFNQSFKDSACSFAQSDTIFMNLYSEIVKTRFKQIK